MIISDVVETVTFKTKTWLKLWDRDFIKNPETEIQDFKICAFCPIWKKMSSLLLSWFFFKFLAFFRPVLVVSYLQMQQTKVVKIYKFYYTISLQYSKTLRPAAFETETRPETFEIETRTNGSQDSSRDQNQVSRLHHWWLFLYAVWFYSNHPCIQLLSDEKQEQISHLSSGKL